MKVLELKRRGQCVLSIAAWQTISLCRPPQLLLPNLKKIFWETQENILPYIHLFVHPGISIVHVTVVDIDHFSIRSSPLDVSALSSLQVAHALEKLFVGLNGGTLDYVAPALCDSLDDFPHLRSFTTTESLADGSVRRLSQLHHLEKLHCAVMELKKDVPLISPVFPSLQRLRGYWNHWEDLIHLLGRVESQVLRELDVVLASVLVTSQLHAFLAMATRKGFSKSVTRLKITPAGSSRTDLPAFNLTPQVMGSLLRTFCNLTELQMPYCCMGDSCGFALDDASMESIAQALPRIVHLSLSPGYPRICRSPSCKVTLKGLKAFAIHCPKLRSLTTHVNALLVPTGIMHGFDQSSQPRSVLKSLHVGDSCVTDSASEQAAIASMFCRLFPSLTLIYCSEGSAWRTVEESLKACQRLYLEPNI